MAKPVIDEEKCNACGTCVQICPVEVFANDGDKIVVKNPDAYIECRACETSCPQEAIMVVE